MRKREREKEREKKRKWKRCCVLASGTACVLGTFSSLFDDGMDFLTWNGMKMTGADDRGPDTDRR